MRYKKYSKSAMVHNTQPGGIIRPLPFLSECFRYACKDYLIEYDAQVDFAAPQEDILQRP